MQKIMETVFLNQPNDNNDSGSGGKKNNLKATSSSEPWPSRMDNSESFLPNDLHVPWNDDDGAELLETELEPEEPQIRDNELEDNDQDDGNVRFRPFRLNRDSLTPSSNFNF